jgi:hypothetical protein
MTTNLAIKLTETEKFSEFHQSCKKNMILEWRKEATSNLLKEFYGLWIFSVGEQINDNDS